MKAIQFIFFFFLINTFWACNDNLKKRDFAAAVKDSGTSCMMAPARFSVSSSDSSLQPGGSTSLQGMVFIKGGNFFMGGDNSQASADEYPKHEVKVNGFWIDATEVTNAEFASFVEATHYITTAEKNPDWEEMKITLPPGTRKPPDSILVAASLVFHPTSEPVDLHDYSQWWRWVTHCELKGVSFSSYISCKSTGRS